MHTVVPSRQTKQFTWDTIGALWGCIEGSFFINQAKCAGWRWQRRWEAVVMEESSQRGCNWFVRESTGLHALIVLELLLRWLVLCPFHLLIFYVPFFCSTATSIKPDSECCYNLKYSTYKGFVNPNILSFWLALLSTPVTTVLRITGPSGSLILRPLSPPSAICLSLPCSFLSDISLQLTF